MTFERPEYGKFLQDSHSAEDILQRQTGDCWFLASVAAVAERCHLMDKIIMPELNETEGAREYGLYRFRFFNLGDWHDVIIDDVTAKSYTANPSGDEYWVPLIQKAYAKFNGSYQNLEGGSPINALYNLTGGVMLGLQSHKIVPAGKT